MYYIYLLKMEEKLKLLENEKLLEEREALKFKDQKIQ